MAERSVIPNKVCALVSAGKARAVWHSEFDVPIRSAADFANAINCDVKRVAKTILLVADALTWHGQRVAESACVCVVLSSPARVDIAAVSDSVSAVSLRLATASEVEDLLGVRPGAVSPIVPGTVPVLLDAALLEFPTIFISGGQPGLDLEMDPRDLMDVLRDSGLVYAPPRSAK